jgi:hypothetical protein
MKSKDMDEDDVEEHVSTGERYMGFITDSLDDQSKGTVSLQPNHRDKLMVQSCFTVDCCKCTGAG